MRKFFKGERINSWEVIDPIRYYRKSKKGNYYPMILCYSEITNELKYVFISNLLNGNSRGISSGNHSTRYKNKHLPKYVYTFPHNVGSKKYRVCKKIKGTNKVKTLGYFRYVKEAREFVQTIK